MPTSRIRECRSSDRESPIGSRVARLSRTWLVCIKLARTAAIPVSARADGRYHRFEETLTQFFELDIQSPPSKIGLGRRESRGIPFHHGMFRFRSPGLLTQPCR